MLYDTANNLAKEMRESEEYKALLNAQTALEGDADAKALAQRFMKQQMEWEYARIAGLDNEKELYEKQKEIIPLVEASEKARNYLQAHARWAQISNDIYRIISEPITEGMKVLDDGAGK